MSRLSCFIFTSLLVFAPAARADVFDLTFTAVIGSGNSFDTGDVFGEGAGADLSGQAIAGAITIDTTGLRPAGAGFGDFGAGAISVSLTLNSVTSTTVSVGTLGYFGNTSGGSVSIGSDHYLAIGAASPDGMVQQSIGVLFDDATPFLASSDPIASVDSLASIAGGAGLVTGGVTFLSPMEHLDATVTSVAAPEPAALTTLLTGLAGLCAAVRRRSVPQTREY